MKTIIKLFTAALASCLVLNAAQAESLKIGIAQLGPHPQLDKVVETFKKELAGLGYKDVAYDYDQIDFNTSLAPQLLTKLQAGKPDLILTVTTPLSQAAKTVLANSGIPVIFSAVTDPVAAKLVPSWDKGAANMTGASDQQDIRGVLKFMRKLLPDAKRLGVPYNPGEDNDVATTNEIKKAAPEFGFEVVEVGVDNANDINVRIRSLQGRADVIYLTTSNLLQPAVPAVAAAANAINVPVVNAAPTPVTEHQVLAAFAVDYAKVGKNAAAAADMVLKGKDIAGIGPLRPTYEDHAAVISGKQMKRHKITLMGDLKNCSCVVE